jgi:hypothetical protein
MRLGARVGIIEGSSGSAADLLKDGEWNGVKNLVRLPSDPAPLRSFLAS